MEEMMEQTTLTIAILTKKNQCLEVDRIKVLIPQC